MIRQCDACAACCTAMPVQGLVTAKALTPLDKPAHETCHFRGKQGCSVYEGRPGACREWSCAWLTNSAIPEKFRPDLSGVILSGHPALPPDAKAFVAIEVAFEAFKKADLLFAWLGTRDFVCILQGLDGSRSLRGRKANIERVSEQIRAHAARVHLPIAQ